MCRILGLYIVLLSGVISSFGCNSEGLKTDDVGLGRGLFSLEGNAYDFGKKLQKQTLLHEFQLKNAADVPVRIISLGSSCGCTWSSDSENLVGNTVRAEEIFRLPVFLQTGVSQDTVSGKVMIGYEYVTGDDKEALEGKLVLEVRAQIVPDFKILPKELDFGEVNGLGAQRTKRRFVIEPDSLENLEITSIVPSSDCLSCRMLPRSPHSNGYEIEATLDLTSYSKTDYFRGHFVVETNSQTLPQALVQAGAQYIAPVDLQPTSIVIPSSVKGTTEEKLLIFSSVPSCLKRFDFGGSLDIRAIYDEKNRADRHEVLIQVDSSCGHDLDKSISIEIELFPQNRDRVLHVISLPVYRFFGEESNEKPM